MVPHLYVSFISFTRLEVYLIFRPGDTLRETRSLTLAGKGSQGPETNIWAQQG